MRRNIEYEKILQRSLGESCNLSEEMLSAETARVWRDLEEKFRGESRALRFSMPATPTRVPRLFSLLAIAATALAVVTVIVLSSMRLGVHAIVENGDGTLYGVVDGEPSALAAGSRISAGEAIRSAASGAWFRLSNGSRVEMRARSEVLLEGADDGARLRLMQGSIIVNAAKQASGHLYVVTNDITVSVVGTVFLVNAEEEGSRVAVIDGEVHVRQGELTNSLRPGQQVASNPSMQAVPVKEEISWSRNMETHLALLQRSTSTTRPAEQLQFEAAVLRPEQDSSSLGSRGAPARCNGTDGVIPAPRRGALSASASSVPRGRCVGRYVTLKTLISLAYGVSAANISGGPDWIDSFRETFQLETKARDVATVTGSQLQQMLQKLLADRFGLRVRRETKEANGYVLGARKGGHRLQETSGEENLYIVQNGKRNQFNLLKGGRITLEGKSTVKGFAAYLASAPLIALKHVEDHTGIVGMYKFSLTLDMVPPPNGAIAGRGTGGLLSEPVVEWDPSISKAIEEQLGLTITPQKVLEEVIVIDRAEKLSSQQ